MNHSQPDTIARIALSIPEQTTSADILRALNQAYQAGERAGFDRGFTSSTQARRVLDEAIAELLP